MLPQSHRISRKLFTHLSGGKLFHSPHFLLRIAPLEGRAIFGVSVSKKVSKKAVVRNAVRRRVYSLLRPMIPTLAPGIYLISAKPGAERLKGTLLEAELLLLLKKN